MRLLFLVALPLLLGLLSLFIRGSQGRKTHRQILIAGASLHTLGVASLYTHKFPQRLSHFISIDPLGLLFLSITSLLFLFVSIYSFGYFHKEYESHSTEGVSYLYVPCMLFFLAAMTLTTTASHLGLLWVAVEATTLSSAPLIYYHHHAQALEATWKYLLICSVGIALALLGIFFTAAASQNAGSDLFVDDLIAQAKTLDVRWLRIGFILVLVGFGTKMGLAPMHNWLPDAHSEAPSPVSALLSGALLNCAFLGILRFYQICAAAGLSDFAGKLLILFGLASLFVATVFIVGQRDFKRILAYSSIEHMGILALGIGMGAGLGSLLHALNHSLTKGLLFLVSGQIVLQYQTKKVAEVQGLLKALPLTGLLWIVGGLAIMGSPPFSPFISEFLILREGFFQGHLRATSLSLLFLSIIFITLSKTFITMVCGEKRVLMNPLEKYPWLIVPSVALASGVCVLGLYLPHSLVSFLEKAAALLGGAS